MDGLYRSIGSMMLVALSACDGGGSEPVTPTTHTLRDSAGTSIVENSAPVWPEGEGFEVTSAPILSIGAVSGSDAEQFSRIRGLTRLSDGRIVVLEGQGSELRYFDADGAHVMTTGGEGGGPGEFNYASTILRLPGDSVLVEDRPRIRYVVFGPDGSLASESVLDPERYMGSGWFGECPSHLFPDRSRIGCSPRPDESESLARGYVGSPPGLFRSFQRFFWVSPDMESADSLGWYGGLEQFAMDRGGGRFEYILHGLYTSTVSTVSADPPRMYIAVNPEYSVEVWTNSGELERIIRRAGGRQAATDEIKETGLEQALQYVRNVSEGRVRAELPVPDSVAAVFGLVPGPRGEIWVRRALLPADEYPPAWDVFDADGRFLGTPPFPRGFNPMEVGEDYILGVRRDENDVPFVEMYGLDRGG